VKDLDIPEWAAIVPLAVAIVVLGVWPTIVLEVTDPVANAIAIITGGGT